MSKELKSFEGIKKGQKFKVTRNVGSHNYPIGKVLTFKVNGTVAHSMNNIAEGGEYNNIRIDELELFSETLADMRVRRDEIAKFKNDELTELDEKIRICEELGLEVYDKLFVDVHRCLETINSDSTLFEKTTLILSILKAE